MLTGRAKLARCNAAKQLWAGSDSPDTGPLAADGDDDTLSTLRAAKLEEHHRRSCGSPSLPPM